MRREEKLKKLLLKENLDIMFPVEMDMEMIKEDYKIPGYKMILPKLAERQSMENPRRQN